MDDRAFTGTSFYQFLGESKLMGARCQSCEALHVPPRAICPDCFGEEMVWEQMRGDGKLVAFTTVHIAPTAMLEAGYDRKHPYCAGIVQLAEGPRISAQILGLDALHPEEIEVGMPVHIAFVQRGEGEAQQTYLAFERV
jgi:uncharacterized OB-fold protein